MHEKNKQIKLSMLGICYDRTQTFRKGAAAGPKILRAMFPKLETYISGIELNDIFIKDIGNIRPKNEVELKSIERIIDKNAFLIMLGGEHTVSYPCIRALKPDVVVWLDAHPDCEASPFLSHNSVAAKLIEEGFELIFCGMRSCSKKEKEFMDKNRVKTISLQALEKLGQKSIKLLQKKKWQHSSAQLKLAQAKRIYLSIDFDVLDPSVIPWVGNPEPDGMQFKDVLRIVKALAPKLIAIDFVEYTPIDYAGKSKEGIIWNTIAAKLIYYSIAEVMASKGCKT